MSVRSAQPADLDDVVHLIAAFRDWWGKTDPPDASIRATAARLLADPQTDLFLAFDESGAAIGVCQVRYRLSIWTGSDDAWLEDLFVVADARGGGHGRALAEAAFESARARGCKRIELDVNAKTGGAMRFYESIG